MRPALTARPQCVCWTQGYMRARQSMLGPSSVTPGPGSSGAGSFEETLFNVSSRTKQRQAFARSLEAIPRFSLSAFSLQAFRYLLSIFSD
jgi:hypothetical protein